MQDYQHLHHEFDPVYTEYSRVLILGTFPSVKSREQCFYYGHPQNRFWPVISALTKEVLPISIEEKKRLLNRHDIAVWDVVQDCDIIGSSDTSIKNVIPADLPWLLSRTPMKQIFGNGAKACELYDKYLLSATHMPIHKLPSTSPANAAWSLERLLEAWSAIL